GSQPRRMGPGSAHRARTQQAEPYPIMPVTKLHKGSRISCKLYVRSCRIRWSAGKTTVEHRKCVPPRPQTRGCCRSTEFEIVVPRPPWRKYFSPKTCHQQKAEMRKSIGQQ